MARRDFRQLGLADSIVQRRGKKSEWLDWLDAALDWPALETIVEGIHASREGGLAYPLLTHVKLLLLQQWYGPLDEGLEAAVDDRLSFRRFAGIEGRTFGIDGLRWINATTSTFRSTGPTQRPARTGRTRGSAREETMRRPCHRAVLLALATGGALSATPALAAPATLPDKATPLTVTHGNQWTPRTFTRLNQVTWYKVRLDKGQDYALWGYDGGDGYPYASPTVTVYGPTGKRLQSFPIGSTDVVSGREFRAPVAGTYYLEPIAAGQPGGSFPYTYYVGVAFDCRGGPTTRCTLAVGQKPTGFYNFYLDDDARRITAKAGRRYTLLLSGSGSLAATAEVRDRNGKLVGQCAAEGRLRPCVSFTAAYSGPYYAVATYPDEESGPYQLGLTSP